MTAPAWRRVIASDAMAAEYAGRVPLPEGATAAMRVLFDRLDREGGFVHWADFNRARGWIREAERLASAEEEARVDGLGLDAQGELTVKLWRAIGQAYRALDVPWINDPAARTLFLRATSWQDSETLCDAGEWAERAKALGAYVSPDGGRCVHCVHRVAMSADGNVAAPALYNGQGTGDYWGEGVHHGRRLWDWKAYAFNYHCQTRTVGACDWWISRFLTPLHWHYLLGRRIAHALADRGPVRVLFESVRACMLYNLVTAQKAGVLAREGGAPLAAAVAPLAGLSDLQLAEGIAAMRDDTTQAIPVYLGVVGGFAGAVASAAALIIGGTAAATAASTGVGLVFAVVIALGLLLSFVLPQAMARNVDPFGRDRPVLERPSLSGTVRSAPTHAVDDPPAWTVTSVPAVLLPPAPARTPVTVRGAGAGEPVAPGPPPRTVTSVPPVLLPPAAQGERVDGDPPDDGGGGGSMYGAPPAPPSSAAPLVVAGLAAAALAVALSRRRRS